MLLKQQIQQAVDQRTIMFPLDRSTGAEPSEEVKILVIDEIGMVGIRNPAAESDAQLKSRPFRKEPILEHGNDLEALNTVSQIAMCSTGFLNHPHCEMGEKGPRASSSDHENCIDDGFRRQTLTNERTCVRGGSWALEVWPCSSDGCGPMANVSDSLTRFSTLRCAA
jgi:hypothetical protein